MSHQVVESAGYDCPGRVVRLPSRANHPRHTEAYQHLDASISSLDGFLRPRLDRLSNNINSAVLDPKKLGWFQEINARAVWRILAKLARHGQVDTLSYRSLRARWQTLQSAWDTQLASIVDTTSSGPVLAEVATDMTSADAILSADDDGLTALHLAVIGGCVPAASAMISVLYADGGERARNAMGDLLLIALRTQNDPIIYCLLTSCADLYHRSSRGEIALHVAVQVQRIDYAAPILQAMRKQGASLDVPDSSRAWTPLFFACANGCAEMAQLLIEAGSSQEQRDRLGWTAREIASYKGHLVVAGLFAVLDTSLTGGPANTLSHPKADASNRGCSHDQRVIIISLGATHSDRAVAGLDLSSWFCRKYEAASFVLDISAPGASERRRVPLPILDHQMHDAFCFIVSNTIEPCLVFDMIRLPRIPGKEVLVASGTALLTKNAKQLGTYRQSLIREQSVPILEKGTMRMAGVVTFTPLVVHPFPHLQTARPTDLMRTFPTPPLLIGHRGAGQNVKTRKYLQIGENTIGSFLSAAKLGASYVEFDIQITRDRQAVAFHDLSLSESGTDIPIHDVTLDQFLHASNTQSPHGNPLSMLGPAHSREEAGRPRSRSLGRQFEAGATQVRDRIKYTVDFNKKGFKPNTRGSFIQDSFATLQEILITLPQNIGCDIEISLSPPLSPKVYY